LLELNNRIQTKLWQTHPIVSVGTEYAQGRPGSGLHCDSTLQIIPKIAVG
jgi:hypothetical protein